MDCLNFLMDFINEVAGYTEKHYSESRLTTEELIHKYRQDYREFEANI